MRDATLPARAHSLLDAEMCAGTMPLMMIIRTLFLHSSRTVLISRGTLPLASRLHQEETWCPVGLCPLCGLNTITDVLCPEGLCPLCGLNTITDVSSEETWCPVSCGTLSSVRTQYHHGLSSEETCCPEGLCPLCGLNTITEYQVKRHETHEETYCTFFVGSHYFIAVPHQVEVHTLRKDRTLCECWS